MRIQICGFYGFGNIGDEAILQSIMDELGINNEYIISTSLPYNYWDNYYNILKNKDYRIVDIRSHEDLRTDFDAYILGGGELNFGYGWRQCLSVFANKLDEKEDGKKIKCMNYAVGYNRKWYYSNKLYRLYYEFLKNFDRITVRDMHSSNLIKEIEDNQVFKTGGLNPILTFDPSILLEEEKFDWPEKKVLVFPRYEDYGVHNQPQLDWIIRDMLENSIRPKDVTLVACAPISVQGIDVDLELCKYLSKRIEGSQILNISGFEPRKIKYLIKNSKLVYSGGRYHPIVWAIEYGIPFKMSPTGFGYAKNMSIIDMFRKYGKEGLVELAKKNKEIFFEMMNS